MDSLWEADFDFYETEIEGIRTFVMLDLNAGQAAPLASHPLRLQVRTQMKQPREDGLRSNEESENLFDLEDEWISAIETQLEGLFVGRIVGEGYTTYVLYIPADMEDAADQLIPTLESNGYKPEWFTEEDSEWEFYDSFLSPDDYEFQTIYNRRLLQECERAGDILETPREIDHYAWFPTQEEANAAISVLSEKGYVSMEPSLDEEDQTWRLEFKRTDPLSDQRPDEFVFEILDCILPHHGKYGGWGSMLQLPPQTKASESDGSGNPNIA
jgi:hypothetical protein